MLFSMWFTVRLIIMIACNVFRRDIHLDKARFSDFKDKGILLRTLAVASWSLNFGMFGLRKTLLVLPQQAWTQPMVTHPPESEGYDLTCKKVLISCPMTKPRTDFMIYRGYS